MSKEEDKNSEIDTNTISLMRVHRAANPTEAGLMRNMLKSEKIFVYHVADTGMGRYAKNTNVEIIVNAEDAGYAKDLIEHYLGKELPEPVAYRYDQTDDMMQSSEFMLPTGVPAMRILCYFMLGLWLLSALVYLKSCTGLF